MEGIQLAVAAAAQANNGAHRRLLQARGDVGPLAVAVSASACITALKAPAYTPAVVVAVLVGIITLFTGVWVSTMGRGRRGIGLVNLCFSFLVLVVAIAGGGEFDADLLLKLYNALI